jgi:anti-anti-sigma factor
LSGQQPWLDVIEVREDGRVRVCLRGELDLASAPAVTECLRGLRERRETVLLDLDDVAFIDARGLRVLLVAVADAAGEGLALTVTRGSRAVRQLLALVGSEGHLPLDGSAT